MELERAVITLARAAVERYLDEQKKISPPADLPGRLLTERGGVFVTLKKSGQLRGCVGTYQPTCDNLAREIIKNAISAAFRDPRFAPLVSSELSEILFTVSLLGKPQPVTDINQLDPKKYGVIAEKHGHKGLLLPDLEGLNTVEQQLAAVHRKAALPADEKDVNYQRFTVEKYSEPLS